jgi:hypothetical protein
MSATTVVLVVLTAAGFPLLLWAIGRAVTAAGERAAHGLGRSRQYLAGRLNGVQITALIEDGDELLVGLGTQATDAHPAAGGLLAKVFRATALMLADPVLGGNAACEPATTATWQDPKPAISHDQSPPDDS